MVVNINDRVKVEKGIAFKKIFEGIVTKVVEFEEGDGDIFDFELKHIYIKLDCGKKIKIVSQNNQYTFERYRILGVI